MKTSPGLSRIQVIDTHTGGEPTRVVVDGGPDLGNGTMTERRARFRDEFDAIRAAIVNEPRGSDVLVGALLTPPVNPDSAAGVIFFNNVGVLNMCGHGTIGVAVTLAHMGQIGPGNHLLDTSAGTISVRLHDNRTAVTLENVPSYRFRHGVAVDVPGHGRVTGDVAWGGNWFFLCDDHGLAIESGNLPALIQLTVSIRALLDKNGITGVKDEEIDHIELIGPSFRNDVDARNFVLCPGEEWDRSPCGTGTSAKVACLAADGKLEPGEIWRQESVIGSIFEATYRIDRETKQGEAATIPLITGSAWVNAESTLILNPDDPFCMGLSR